MYKDQFDGSALILVLTFHFQLFMFFQFYSSYKDRFDGKCNSLGTVLIENFRNLGTCRE